MAETAEARATRALESLEVTASIIPDMKLSTRENNKSVAVNPGEFTEAKRPETNRSGAKLSPKAPIAFTSNLERLVIRLSLQPHAASLLYKKPKVTLRKLPTE